MKITTKNAIYIQKRDLVFLKDIYRILPLDIINKIFANSSINIYDLNDFDFIKFADKEIIEYFKSLDCITNYIEIRNLTSHDLTELGKTWYQEYEQVAKHLYSLKPSNPEYEKIFYEYKMLDYKILSLRHIIDFFNGILDMPLPFPYNQKLKVKKLVNKIIPIKN